MRAIALGYHDVSDAGPRSNGARLRSPYTVSSENFACQLDLIRELAGPEAIEVIQGRHNWHATVPVFLTFDDGNLSGYTNAAAELEKRKWRGHFFITTDWISRPGFLDPPRIRELHERGHVIGSHACSHPERMTRLTWQQLLDEWSRSCDLLSEIIGGPVKVASVPGGYYSRRVGAAAAAAGIEVLFTSQPRSDVSIVEDCFIIGRYWVRRTTPNAEVGAIAAGARWPRWRQAACWSLKSLIKQVTGRWYLSARRALGWSVM